MRFYFDESVELAVSQQLERAGFIKKRGNKGREMTSAGRSYMDKVSSNLKKELAKAIPELERYA